MRAGAKALLAGLVIFPAALGGHECFHLLALHALGGTGQLIVRPWRFEFLPATLPSLHVTGGASLSPVRRVVFDLAGPLLAALVLLVGRRWCQGRALPAALGANVVILVFFGAIETADYVLDFRPSLALPVLTWEEFNYGLPLLALAVAAGWASRRASLRA